ncbi:MAG: serine hydrolase domain-containing protein [Woeseiaceae bacterium]
MIRKLLIGFALAVLSGILLLYLTGNAYILKAVQRTYLSGHTTANIDDHMLFDTRQIRSAAVQEWQPHPDAIGDALSPILLDYMTANKASAFVVIVDGKLYAERYFEPYTATSKTNSFSMAKTVLTLLLGAAIEDGIVSGLDTPVTQWLPEFSDEPNAAAATLGMLSSMTSGYDWDEHYYSPFSPTVALLYSHDVGKFLLDRSFSDTPGTRFYYSSASTQLLAIALSRALASAKPGLTLSEYLSTKLWQPMGMNDDGLWHLDGTGMELGYCCLNTNARNFAKFGQLFLQSGAWQGNQLVSASFIDSMHIPGPTEFYGYSTWIDNAAPIPHYAMRGHLGQYVIVVPSRRAVIVRLGQQMPKGLSLDGELLPFYIEHALAALESD